MIGAGEIMNICFTLSMPNRGSWNGRWSGEDNLYAVIKKLSPKHAESVLAHHSYYYRWDDGWGASIAVSKVDGAQSRDIRKRSKGFCGYEWMIDSIITYGKIYADHEIPKLTESVAELATATPRTSPQTH
jgi:hypothetical protein